MVQFMKVLENLENQFFVSLRDHISQTISQIFKIDGHLEIPASAFK